MIVIFLKKTPSSGNQRLFTVPQLPLIFDNLR